MRYLYFIIFIVIGFSAFSSNTLDSRKERILIHSGNEEYYKGNYNGAIGYYNMALKENPTSQIAEFNLASALVSQGTYTGDSIMLGQSVDLFSKLEKSNSKSIKLKSKFDLGNIAFNNKDYKGSIEYYKAVLREDPSNDLARKYLRMAQLKLKNQPSPKEEPKEDKKEESNNNKEQEKQNQNQQDQNQQDQNQQKKEQSNQNQSGNNRTDNLLESIEKKEQQTLMKINARRNNAKRREHEARGVMTDKPW